MESYSPLFHTLYDEQSPVGNLGRGTHYSVLSAVQWFDKRRKLRPVAGIQKFSIIWDEDHDDRVIDVIERAYMLGIFAPVLFVGERKACLTAVVDQEFYSIIQGDWASYMLAWSDLCADVHGDVWSFELMTVDNPDLGIIFASTDKVTTYLQNIDNLWGLGVSSYTPQKNQGTIIPPPPTFFK